MIPFELPVEGFAPVAPVLVLELPPELPQAAAFACANGACSVPVYEAAEVHRIVAKVDDR